MIFVLPFRFLPRLRAKGVEADLNGHWNTDKNLEKGDPRDLIADVHAHLKGFGGNHTYFYMSSTGDQHWTVDPDNPSTLKSQCSSQCLARFLLGVERGCFLGTNGWDADYDRPLGDPLGPAKYTPASGSSSPATLVRKFTSGTYVKFTYDHTGKDGTGVVYWNGVAPPPPPPPPPAKTITCGSSSSSYKSTEMPDTTFSMDDVSKINGCKGPQACCNACADNRKCVQWAWHSGDQKCHLHGPQSTEKHQAGTTAGVMIRS